MRIVRGTLFALAILVIPTMMFMVSRGHTQHEVKPIVGIQKLEPLPQIEEQQHYVYSEKISEEDVMEFKDHELGSKGYLVGDRVECTGEKGDNCIVSVFLKSESRCIYFLECGITDKPIASFDQETRTWTINYTRKVELL